MEEKVNNLELLIQELLERVQALEYRCHNELDNYIGNVKQEQLKDEDTMADTDQLILDHEERIILLEVGE